ncbi:XRE family transcriptional regulator, partial [Patescibacteria group bacterium]
VELAMLGVRTHSNTIANWESGETSPDADALPKLAQALKASVNDFYNGKHS